MPKLYVMVALPRAGKSTYVEKHFKDKAKVSADQLRLIIYGRRYWAGGEGKVFWVRNVMLKALLEQGVDIVIDETNTTKDKRSKLIKLAKEYGYWVTAIVIREDKKTCIERAIETGQVDLISVIEKMAENYEEVSEDEGFDEIIYV